MLKPGIYQHYKNKNYRLIGPAKHTETEEDMVVYQTLYGNNQIWTRPLEMFLGNIKVDGETKPRFIYLGK